MMKKIVLAVTAAALLLGLTACGTSGKPSNDVTVQPKDITTTQPAPQSQNAKFGQSYKWDDGVEVSISAPEAYSPTASAAGVIAGDQNVVFTITVTNNSTENVDPSGAQFTLSSGGVEGSPIGDMEGKAGLGFAPNTPVLPGKTISWNSGWSVKSTSDLTAQFQLVDFNHKPAIFTN